MEHFRSWLGTVFTHISQSSNWCVQEYVCSSNNNLNLHSAFLNIVAFKVLAESCVGTFEVSDRYVCFFQEDKRETP